MGIRLRHQAAWLAAIVALVALSGCYLPAAPGGPVSTALPAPTREIVSTVPASATPSVSPTQVAAGVVSTPTATLLATTPNPSPNAGSPTLPARAISIKAPQVGAAISSPARVQGSVTITPFEATLQGTVYDAQGKIVGQGPVHVQGEMGQPGTFDDEIPFTVTAAGPGRVQLAEISMKDGSVVVSGSTQVTLKPGKAGQAGVGALHNANQDGVSFSFSTAVAGGVQAATLPAVKGGQDDPYWAPVSQRVQFTLTNYVLPNTFHQPQIIVYPTDEMAKANEDAGTIIGGLRQLLASRPDQVTGALPFLPIFNAHQQVHVDLKYIDFQNGNGVRYLTQFDQAPIPLNNHELFYTFQGLTKDGKYYVAAILPVSNQILPADGSGVDMNTIGPDFAKYLEKAAQQLEAQPPESFTPTLAQLDQLIASLSISQ